MATVRQQITIDAASRSVWASLTTEEGLAIWWASEARLDPREGGRIVVTRAEGGDEVKQDRGIFLRLAPTRAIEIAFDGGPWRGTRVEFQVGRGDGETKLHVVHSGAFEGEGEREALDAWWKAALTRLRARLEG